MRIIILIVFIITKCSISVFSQDLIIKKNGDEISAKVTEITTDAIKYKRFENTEGPVYSIPKNEVFMIRYQNGSKETFSQESKSDKLIPSGTEIKIKSINRVLTRKVKDGDELRFETNENILVGNKLIIPRGTPVYGIIKDVEKGKVLGKEGKMEIVFDFIQLSDGTKIKVTTTKNIKGKNYATSAVVGAVLLSPLWLLTTGGNAKIKEGEIFSIFVE